MRVQKKQLRDLVELKIIASQLIFRTVHFDEGAPSENRFLVFAGIDKDERRLALARRRRVEQFPMRFFLTGRNLVRRALSLAAPALLDQLEAVDVLTALAPEGLLYVETLRVVLMTRVPDEKIRGSVLSREPAHEERAVGQHFDLLDGFGAVALGARPHEQRNDQFAVQNEVALEALVLQEKTEFVEDFEPVLGALAFRLDLRVQHIFEYFFGANDVVEVEEPKVVQFQAQTLRIGALLHSLQ